jgi:hypothetical protein
LTFFVCLLGFGERDLRLHYVGQEENEVVVNEKGTGDTEVEIGGGAIYGRVGFMEGNHKLVIAFAIYNTPGVECPLHSLTLCYHQVNLENIQVRIGQGFPSI